MLTQTHELEQQREQIQGMNAELREFKSREAALDEAQRVARSIYDRIRASKSPGMSFDDDCGSEDICINIALEFEQDKDVLATEDLYKIGALCEGLKVVLLEAARSEEGNLLDFIQIVVEGHTNAQQKQNPVSDEEAFRWNWNLSARRASAVMFAMNEAGIGQPRFNVVSWGRADSTPICRPPLAKECLERNRRTTIRLKFDYKRYAERAGR